MGHKLSNTFQSKISPNAKFNRLKLISMSNETIASNLLAQSITELEIDRNSSSTFYIGKNVLPHQLKKLTIRNRIVPIQKRGSLILLNEAYPLKLTEVTIHDNLNPSSFNQLSNHTGLLKLEFINIYSNINSGVVFPNSLEKLIVVCRSFSAKLPNKLKLLNLNMHAYDHKLNIPSSLEDLSICYEKNSRGEKVFQNFQSVPNNLKSLGLSCSSLVDDNGISIIPNKLETLVIHNRFNSKMKSNQLPPTLTFLNMGSDFDQVIEPNVLPVNLKTLVLSSRYSQEINPLAIPSKLKLLKIKNNLYNKPINLTNSTHPNTIISSFKYNHKQAKTVRYNRGTIPKSGYIHLNHEMDVKLSEIPINNNIKILELSFYDDFKINLDQFKYLETIIIPLKYSLPTIIAKKVMTNSNQQQQDEYYLNYNLKNIIVSPQDKYFIKNLDPNFYQFIKYNNNTKYNKQ